MKMKTLFTSESVSMGHPDKICDQIADRILDAYLSLDQASHVAIEVMARENEVYVSGEVTSSVKIEIEPIVKATLLDIGYDKDELGTNGNTIKVYNLIREQSPEINNAVVASDPEHLGAGDQGIMFGYATSESPNYMPLGISIAHALVRRATDLRRSGAFEWARPDMKAQATIDYTDLDNIKIDTLLMSIQHNPDTDMNMFTSFVHDNIMVPVAKKFGLNTDFKYLVNPSGSFIKGGPSADTGMSGRKVIVDTYGGSAEHGGGSFSGKDPTKVDRSGAYMARYIAKNLVAAGAADRILIQISYAIGKPSPISIGIKTYHSARYSDEKILECIEHVFDCRVGKIIEQFSLTSPSFWYSDLSNYGHFGRDDISLPWEQLDKVDAIKEFLSK